MKTMNSTATLLFALLSACASPSSDEARAGVRQDLSTLEQESHQLWLDRDAEALDRLMADEFHFVAMNGALEPKHLIVGSARGPADKPRMLEIESMQAEPGEVFLHGDTAVVISLLHIEATVRGRRLPNRMRILSVFHDPQRNGAWRLIVRSITPILAPPQQ